MAAKQEKQTITSLKQKVIEDYLTCIICSDTYEDPQQLKCQHTFCLKCLTDYIQKSQFQGSFPCPVCRTKIDIHGNKLDAQKHLLIADMLIFFNSVKEFSNVEAEISFPTSVSKVCNLCEEERRLDSYCSICYIWLCEPCTRGHKKILATKSHSLMQISEFYKFIELIVKEKCIKISAMKDDIEERMTLLQSVLYTTSESKSQVEFEIIKRYQTLQNTIERQKNGLLQQLDLKYSGISQDINLALIGLQQMHLRISGLIDLHQNLQKEPTGIQGTEVDDLDMAAELIKADYKSFDNSMTAADVPIIEFKAVYKNDDLLEPETAFGNIILRSHSADSIPYVGDGVTCKMEQCLHGNQLTGLSVFHDKHYLVVSNDKVLVYMDYKMIDAGLKSKTSTSFWGVTHIGKNKIILTSMESCLGSGKITLYQKNSSGTLQNEAVVIEGLTSPRGVCSNHDGSFMVSDQFERCIYCFSQDCQLKRIIKKAKDGSPLFVQPMFVTQNKNGDIVVSDHGAFVKILSPDGDIKYTYVSDKPKSEFWGVATDKNGNILIADWNHGIHILKENGDFKMLRNDFPYGMHPMSIDRHPQNNTFMIGTSAGEIYHMS